MCVAVATVAAIGAGTSIASAKIQSNAAKNAAKTQTEAANKSLAFQQQQFANQQAAFQPYQQAGARANAQLSNLASRPTPQFVPGGQQQAFGAPQGQLGMPQGMPPQPVSRPMGGAMPPPQGRMVMVQAPTGETQQMPEAEAQRAVQAGARVIG